ncbi:MAG: hypothetical protein ACI9JN_002538 [Bacteroidia bacterium]|jgi:hypothetical protein
MRNITLLLLVFGLACNKPGPKNISQAPQETANQDYTQFDWLTGVWERSMQGNNEMNHFETWSQQANRPTGTGTTIMGDAVTNEQMWIYAKNDTFYYIAHPEQNPAPTLFTITEIKDSFFRCENTTHDFPKYIEYKRSGDSLFAYIGDTSQRITFKFRFQHERNFR